MAEKVLQILNGIAHCLKKYAAPILSWLCMLHCWKAIQNAKVDWNIVPMAKCVELAIQE